MDLYFTLTLCSYVLLTILRVTLTLTPYHFAFLSYTLVLYSFSLLVIFCYPYSVLVQHCLTLHVPVLDVRIISTASIFHTYVTHRSTVLLMLITRRKYVSKGKVLYSILTFTREDCVDFYLLLLVTLMSYSPFYRLLLLLLLLILFDCRILLLFTRFHYLSHSVALTHYSQNSESFE